MTTACHLRLLLSIKLRINGFGVSLQNHMSANGVTSATKEELAGRLQYLGQLDAHRHQIRIIRSMVNRTIRTI
jgi:hypothetical protein